MIKREDYFKPHKCPVCGKYEFPYHGSDEFCEVCGWQDDAVQEKDPEFGGANWEGLKGYRALYKAGMHEKSNDVKYAWLKKHGLIKENREDDTGHEYYVIGSDSLYD